MLEVKGLTVAYGRHRALEGVGLRVDKGEICVILGANGAGKSSLLKAIAGMVKADAGDVTMNGRPIARMKPHRIVEEGIALVPEGRGIFGDLSVAENLQLGAFARRARQDEQTTLRMIYELFPRLAERKKQIARTMSGGEQQMVAIGRALMSKPDILMLDEPSLGLSPILTQELFRSLTAVAATGVGILLVEQNAKQSLKIARRGYLIENGHVTGENSAEALRTDPAVVAAYLGGAGAAKAGPARTAIHLPASLRLPATVAAIGGMASDLAARAGRISQAFIRAMRRDEALPSAFVGRYDPKSGADPWQEASDDESRAAVSDAHPPTVSQEARWLAASSANLAARASDRLARHVETTRRGATVPSAFQRRPEADAASPVPAPAVMSPAAEPTLATASHGLIGHNSGAAGMGALDESAPHGTKAAPALSIVDLAAHAAAIQRRHVEARRGTLAPFMTLPPTDGPAPAAAAPEPVFSPGLRAPQSIADLAARAADIQRRHVDETRKSLTALTIPSVAVIPDGIPGPGAASDEGNNPIPDRKGGGKSARKGKKSKKKHGKHEEAR